MKVTILEISSAGLYLSDPEGTRIHRNVMQDIMHARIQAARDLDPSLGPSIRRVPLP